MLPTYRACFSIGLIMGMMSTISNLHAEPVETVNDFHAIGEQIKTHKTPLLLMIEAEHCGYCKRLKSEQIQPINNDTYRDKVIIRTLRIDDQSKISGFDGSETTPAAFSKKYQAFLTPTVLFLDHEGKEVAKRMLGYNTPDYYGAFLDTAIETARKEILTSLTKSDQ